MIHNGVDHMDAVAPSYDVVERLALEDKGYFLALGSQAPHKNIDLLIDTFAELDPDRYQLVVAGSKNQRVFADGKGRNDPANVIRTGRVSDQELKALYQGATALLFPSKTEGFGLPPLEAMYCNCPVIVSSGGALPEVCGDAAVYVDPTDATGWNEAIKRMAADKDLRADLRTKGAARAGKFKWSDAASRLLELLSNSEVSQ